jgi:transcriptional regulator with XRE-family HTH domain
MYESNVTKEEICRRLASNIRFFRMAAGLTVEQAAARAEIDCLHWYSIEDGTVHTSLYALLWIADALGVETSDLLGEPRSQPPLKLVR